MYFLKPTVGEVYFLRLLLTIVKGKNLDPLLSNCQSYVIFKGPTGFENLQRVPGHTDPLPTFQAACLARGLLEDDGEWRLCLQEAAEMHTGTRLRHLFVTLLLFGEPSQPDLLWHEFKQHICDDLAHRLRAMNIMDTSSDAVYDYRLFLIDNILCESGHFL